MTDELRLCLDLNIWCAAFISGLKGRQGSASQCLVSIAESGYCTLGPVQLIVSWGMLNRLSSVLKDKLGISVPVAEEYVDRIREFAEIGPSGCGPQLTLGGTGVIGLKDQEDAHVLETALAGRASVLVTSNFKDFICDSTFNQVSIIEPNKQAIYRTPKHAFCIVQPQIMMQWVRSDRKLFTDYLCFHRSNLT